MPKRSTRRRLLQTVLVLPVLGLPLPTLAATDHRRLRFLHTHTSERLDVTYMEHGRYVPEALDEINGLMRDFRSGEVHPMEPGLLDLLYLVQARAGNDRPYQIISAYRSPKTNAMLRQAGNGVAKRSLHMQGRAIDVRLPGTATRQLRRAALDLGLGGVGYYPKSDFVHLDTGRVRYW